MPRKIIRKSTFKTVKPAAAKVKGWLSQIKWGESYASLFLGAAVVVVAFVLVFSFFVTKNNVKKEAESTSTVTQEEVVNLAVPKTYTVKQGDDLWSIAERIYGSGYNWVDIASANKLQNPNALFVGANLVIPDVRPRLLTVQNNLVVPTNPITGNIYTVVKGDCLWTIAVRAYGDGYKWSQIARANKLVNPDLIHPGNIFVLPR